MEETGENASPDLVRLRHHQSSRYSWRRDAISNLLGSDMQQRSAGPESSIALSAAYSRRYCEATSELAD